MSSLSLQLPLPLPEPVRPWLTLNAEFCVIVCHAAACQQAINPDQVNNHLSRTHTVKVEIRKQLTDYRKQWQWPYDFRSVPLPPDHSLPQPVLPVINGFQCLDCVFKTINRGIIRQHCNAEHHKKRLPDAHLFRAVQLQTWFTAKRARYWVVVTDATRQARDHHTCPGSGSGSGSGSSSSETIEAAADQWEAEVKQERLQLSRTPQATEISPWLRFTDWPRVLSESQHDLLQTYAFTATATATEPGLTRVQQAWGRILERCLETLESINHKDILKLWAEPQLLAVSQVPFQVLEKSSLSTYSQTFLRLLFYLLRTAPTVDWKAESETGVIFTRRQWQCVKRIRLLLQPEPVPVAVIKDEDEDDDDHELTTAVMQLIVSLVTEDTSQMSLYETPIMHYLAVRGIHTATGTFRPPGQYTPILAQMLWMCRLVLLEIAVSDRGWPELALKSRVETGAVAGAVAVRVRKIRMDHLVEGSFSPVSGILTQLAMGQVINRVQQNASNVLWSDDSQTVFYQGRGVVMAKLKTMCVALMLELEALLQQLLFHQPVPPLPLPQLVDSMSSSQLFQGDGYSFVDHVDNAATCQVGWRFLWRQMLQDDPKHHLSQTMGSGSGRGSAELDWNSQRCQAYLLLEKRFLTQLMVALHIMGGQPARAPEIGSIKVRNNKFSTRNIFIINGRVAVATTYDKSQKRRNKTKHILRYLPVALSQVLVQYLVYVLPLTRVLRKNKEDFLFGDEHGPWKPDVLTTALAVATAQHLGARLTVSAWRQVAIAIADKHLRKATQVWHDEEDEEAVAGTEGDPYDHILTEQSGHGRLAAHNHYAIDGAFLAELGPDLVQMYSQASRVWHTFLGLESKPVAVAVAVAVKRESEPLPRPGKRVQLDVSLAMQGLRKVLGPTAQPQSHGQAHALELVHTASPIPPQIIILGTGSGKSLLFFSVAALVTHQTVLVVVPFASLVDDLVHRARSHHLTCEEWQWQRTWAVLPQLLVVSADRAVDGDFLHFAKGLELRQQLAHVFFDECHVAVTDTSYRAKLRELWQLRYLQCRFTCLTATLLPCLEPVFRANLLLEHASIYRQSTMRPTIRYRVIDCHPQSVWDVASPVIRGLPLPPGSRGVIYVRSYAQGESVADAMACPFYKATATGKQALLEQWRSGSGGWIVATGALGTGLNIGRVVYILHLGRPYGLTSFMQQAGRGGRAGEISDSIVILPSSGRGSASPQAHFDVPRPELVSTYSVEAHDEAALTEFLASSTCRRAVLARHLDGQVEQTSCTATDSILCDRCSEGVTRRTSGRGSGSHGSPTQSRSCDAPATSASDAIQQALHLEIQPDEQLARFHQLLHPHCVYCRLMLDEVASHCHRDCPHAAAQGCDELTYRQWRARLQLAPRQQCFRCGLGQSTCRAVEEQRPCSYPHLLLPGLFFLQQVGELWKICREAGFAGPEKGEWQWQWLNQEGEGRFGRREINWMRVWRRVAVIYLEIVDRPDRGL